MYNEQIAKEKGYYVDQEGNTFSKFRQIKPYLRKGYCYINFRYEDKKLEVSVHRLQAYQKYGEELFNDGIQVRHLNNISSDNSAINIAIGTASDNMMDIPEKDRIIKASFANRKYSDEFAKVIQQFHSIKRSYMLTMEKYNISSKGSLSLLLKRNFNI
jgi:hypothetical protein